MLLGLKPSPLQLGLEPNIRDLGGDWNPQSLIEITQLVSGLTYADSGSFFLVQKEFSERQHHRALVRDTSGQARECSPENKECYSFIVKKKKVGKQKDHLLLHSWVYVKVYIISSSFGPIWSNWDCHGVI